jgi:hypothetical protein
LSKVFYVFTEGKKTEFNYLNDLKKDLRLKKVVINIYGLGKFGSDLIERVMRDKKENEFDNKDTEQEWCIVLDIDGNKDFDKIIELAKSHDIQVFYSNECFEMWVLLHFEFISSEIERKNYNSRLTGHLGYKYEKNNVGMYAKIKDKESFAIKNAKKLEKMHDDEGVKSFFKRNPSSTVYRLVETLRELKNND